MNIVFFCQSCGARFEVPPASAGKKGRCKKCGQMMAIPQAKELASMVALPAIAPAALTSGASLGAKGKDSLAWLASAPSSVALAPLTAEKLRPISRQGKRAVASKYDDDLGDSKPYKLGEPLRPSVKSYYPGGRPAGALTMLWRRELGRIQRFFRWLNETAYLVSVPFLMMILFGAVVRNRPVALLGAAVVVLLNLGRVVTGLANLLVIPFRDGIATGVMFLIPPLTVFYASSHWGKLRKPTMRIVTPVLTIAAVFGAFTFVPSLRRDGSAASLSETARDLKTELIEDSKKLENMDVNALKNQAVDKLRDAGKQLNQIGQPETKN